MKKKIVVLFILLLSVVSSFAQSNNDKARAYFMEAKSSYETGNFGAAIDYSTKAENLLGSTNPVILSLKVKAYFNLQQYDNAQASLSEFSKLSANADAELVKETLSYIVKIDDAIAKEQSELEKARQAQIDFEEEHRLYMIELEKKEMARRAVIFKRDGGEGQLVSYYYSFGEPKKHIFWNAAGEIEVTIPEDSYIFDKNYLYYFDKFFNGYNTVRRIHKDLKTDAHINENSDPNIKIALINKRGELIVPFIFDKISRMSEGLIAVGMRTGEKGRYKDNVFDLFKWGYLNEIGQLAIPLEYSRVHSFSDGMAAVYKDGHEGFGFIDKTGALVIPFQHYCLMNSEGFKNGKARVGTKNCKKMFYINKKGERVE